jgi:biopolymer transport protein ExbD
MGMSVNGGGYGSRRRAGGQALSEINVTPFVDVVLVLLIIFMLTAHVMEYGLEVEAPTTKIVKETAKDLPVVTITKDAKIFLNADPVNINDLKSAIEKKFGNPKDGVYVKGDKAVIWEKVAQVTGELGAAGFKVNMVTQMEESSGRAR